MITFVIPCAVEHLPHLDEAIASVERQTVPSVYLHMVDYDQRGPAVLRNEMLRQVETPYVSFLDADDWLEPDYAERMLAASRPGRYAYPDWYQDGVHIKAPAHAWCAGSWHTITAVVPTQIAQMVGGFDETLIALEDTEFFLKIVTRNICGVRVPYPLMHYRKDGGRAKAAHESGLANTISLELNRRYGGIRMACCGNEETINQGPLGVQQPGDVLAQALWGGNRAEHGRATGRPYPRMSFPASTWVDPRDVEMAPALWREVRAEPAYDPDGSELDPIKASGQGVPAIVGGMVAQGIVVSPPDIPAPVAVSPKPDFDKVKKLAKRGRKRAND